MDCHAQADNETDIFSSTEHLWSSITTRVPKCTLLWYGSSRDKWRLGRRWKLSVASHLLSLVLKFPLMCESLKHSLLMQRYLWKLCNPQEKAWGAKLSWVLHCCLGWEISGHWDTGFIWSALCRKQQNLPGYTCLAPSFPGHGALWSWRNILNPSPVGWIQGLGCS